MLKQSGRITCAALALLLPGAAWADITSTQTLSANTRFNLDTGATVTSAGDILFTGTSITFQGSATGYSLGALGSTSYGTFTQTILSQFSSLYSATAISGSTLVVNELFAVHTNGGHYAKVLITAVSSSSLSFQYTTYGVTGGGGTPGGPTISGLINNYSGIVPGLPNYGIAPGSLFVIYGSAMSNPAVTTISALQDSTASGGLPLTLNGASISVTVGSVTTHPAMYYAIPSQIAAVLPSNTPVGTGTITVTYNGLSGTAPIQVVASALGLDTVYATGSGLGVATNANYKAFNYNFSANPGDTIILWGSGLGADPADSDTSYAVPGHTINANLQIYIGGLPATISYQGGSGYPGLNQINVVIPKNVPTGCGVSVVGVVGSVVSNTVTIPINPGGGVCSDAVLGINGNQILSQGTTNSAGYTFGDVSVSQSVFSGTTGNAIEAIFYKYAPATVTYSGFSTPSLGSCIIIPSTASSSSTATAPTGLDAGTISVTGPGGTQQLTNQSPGFYNLTPSSTFLPPSFGTFTFTGSGGKDVGAFSTTVSYSDPLVWTNMNSITSVNRSQGVTVNWTGGATGTYVYIFGGSTSGSLSVSFECYAPVTAGTFSVPSYVLLALPAGSGSLEVFNVTTPTTFSASGLTQAVGSASVEFGIAPSYQ